MIEEKKHICKYCGKEFETGIKLGGHITKCKENPKYKDIINTIVTTRHKNLDINNPLEEHICKCEICGNDYKVNIRHNQFLKGKYNKTCSLECAHKLTNKHTNLELKNKRISEHSAHYCSNKGKKFINGEWVIDPNWKPYNICSICGEKIYNKKRKYCSDECRNKGKFIKLNNAAKKRNLGGYNFNSIKKHHHGNYKGIHCDSSWELAYLVWCLEHNIKIERCNEIRYYTIDNKTYKYFPDFKVNNKIIEIKGYYSKYAKIKSEQNPDIKVLLKNDLNDILKYVTKKYGNKFWEVLYD